MMFWLIAVLTLIGQETISTSVLFAISNKQNHSFLILSIIFAIVTVIEIFVFHHLGLKLQAKRNRNPITDLAEIYILKASKFIDRWGRGAFLLFLAAFLFPPILTSIIASWLGIPLREKIFYLLLGDCIWYLTAWSIALASNLVTNDPTKILLNVIVLSFIFVIFQRRVANQFLSKWD